MPELAMWTLPLLAQKNLQRNRREQILVLEVNYLCAGLFHLQTSIRDKISRFIILLIFISISEKFSRLLTLLICISIKLFSFAASKCSNYIDVRNIYIAKEGICRKIFCAEYNLSFFCPERINA